MGLRALPAAQGVLAAHDDRRDAFPWADDLHEGFLQDERAEAPGCQ